MKRFTDTGIWDKAWFRKLPNRLKSFFRFLCDRCDVAGVWEPDWEAASFYVGEPCTESDLEHFNQNAVMRNGKVFLPQFIEFQYGGLSPDCKPHERVLDAVRDHGLNEQDYLRKPPHAESKVKRSESAIGPDNNGHFKPPTPEEATTYADEIQLSQFERVKFLDFYTSKGWKVGRSPMKDWKAAMRNWQRGVTEKVPANPPPKPGYDALGRKLSAYDGKPLRSSPNI